MAKSYQDSSSFNSVEYWRERYRSGGNSGKGSYGRLAEFKAEVVNSFVRENCINDVIEFGSGDGNQYALLTIPKYVGVDVSADAVARCNERFKNCGNCKFLTLEDFDGSTNAEMTMSLDVIYHLVEDAVFDKYMRQLFSAARRFVIIYSSNKEGWDGAHVRQRIFTRWIDAHEPTWRLHRHIPNKYPRRLMMRQQRSFADFYIYKLCENERVENRRDASGGV